MRWTWQNIFLAALNCVSKTYSKVLKTFELPGITPPHLQKLTNLSATQRYWLGDEVSSSPPPLCT
jgi:hypothetical protein